MMLTALPNILNQKGNALVRFFIAGIRRTGTGFIRTTLNNHPQVRCIGEAFNFGDRFGKTRGEKCEDGYRQFINSIAAGKARDLILRRNTVESFLDQLYQPAAEQKAVGFKLMQKQSNKFPMVLEYLRRHDTAVIHVVRENVLKTLISRTVKRATGQSHTTKAMKKTPVHLETSRLIKDMERFEADNNRWPELCAGMPYLRVSYEDFVANQDVELTRMLDFLNVEPIADLTSHFVKGNPDNIREIIVNYDEVESTLKDTRFEWCLK